MFSRLNTKTFNTNLTSTKVCDLNDHLINTMVDFQMNRFQAMARIMAILCEEGRLTPGSRKYKIARKLISKKIDKLEPNAVFSQAKWDKENLLEQIEALDTIEKTGGNLPKTYI